MLSHKKNEIMPFAATWMNPESFTTLSKSEREREVLYDITYMWNLKYEIYLSMKHKQTHRHTAQAPGCQGGRERSGETGIGSLGLTDANCYI